ncbi:MAG: GerMN domain-containing protein [Actinoplanes sp.]
MRAAAVVLAAMLLAGCGVPAQNEPHPVDLPRQPLSQPASGPSGSTGEVAEVLCLVRDARLVQTVRRLDRVPTVQEQLDDLMAGPTAQERAGGLSSALAGLTLAVTSGPSSAQVTVEVTEASEDNGRIDEVFAYGQVVCTLTTRADVSAVVFTRGGEPLDVPRGDSQLSREPLRARDYANLIGPA